MTMQVPIDEPAATTVGKILRSLSFVNMASNKASNPAMPKPTWAPVLLDRAAISLSNAARSQARSRHALRRDRPAVAIESCGHSAGKPAVGQVFRRAPHAAFRQFVRTLPGVAQGPIARNRERLGIGRAGVSRERELAIARSPTSCTARGLPTTATGRRLRCGRGGSRARNVRQGGGDGETRHGEKTEQNNKSDLLQ